MKTTILMTFIFMSIILLWPVSNSLGLSRSTIRPQNYNMNKDSTNSMKMDMKGMKSGDTSSNKMCNTSKTDSEVPIYYKGIINLNKIDKNKDGKVFQCPMDFNVLSDKPGIDPKCGMKLKEVTIKEAKENLIKHGFQVKG